MHGQRLLAASLLALVVAIGSAASAQDGAPALPAIPDPSECTIDPRPRAFFEQFVGTPASTLTVLAAETPLAEPHGEPATREVAAAVTAAMREEVACFNGGDWLRRAALWTDERQVRAVAHNARYAGQVITPGHVALLAGAPAPLPVAEQAEILGVDEIEVLPDGRVAALVGIEACCYHVPGRRTHLVFFAEDGGQWRIDELLLWAESFGTPSP